MISNKSQITIKVDYSSDRMCRYGYTKSWDENKKNATFILMNPSKGTEFKLDNTIVNINNYCVDSNFGSFTILNLFPLMTTKPNELSGKLLLNSDENNLYIEKALEMTNDIFIAWGSGKKYLRKKKELEKILNKNIFSTKKIKCWKEGNEYPKHLRIMRKKWTLSNYDFKHFDKTNNENN